MPHRSFRVAAFWLATALAYLAVAEDDPYARCDDQRDPVARLACYDEVRRSRPPAAQPPEPEPAARSEIVTQPPQVETRDSQDESSQEAAASAPAADIDAFGRKRGGVRFIDSVVERIDKNYAKERTFHLANGQVWREMWHDRTVVKENDPVRIERSFTGAYRLKVGRFSTRVQRIE